MDTSLSMEGSEKRAVVRFDASSLTPASTIVSARLHFVVTEAIVGSTTVAPISEAWIESQVTWTSRATAQAWSTVGAQRSSSAGAVIAMFSTATLGPISVELPCATAQAWVSAPSSNFGVVLAGGASDVKLAAREAGPTERPELVISYLP